MPWLQLHFELTPDAAQTLGAQLTELGAQAITLRDAANEPVLEPAVGETPLWSRTRLVALFDSGQAPDALLERLHRDLAPAALPPCRIELLQDAPWERAWMERFKPMRFGSRLWICPSWSPPPRPEDVNLRLDPGLAFGTGTHPTTALCLEWLDGQALGGARVVDYGCGSGVLGIAALLLGAAQVWAVDNDPQALVASAENAAANGVARDLQTCPPGALPEGRYDLVLANILAGPLMELAPRLAALLAPAGALVLSGILQEQAEPVAAAYAPWLGAMEQARREGWCRLVGRLQSAAAV